jgi:putative iron-regulated protein
MSNSIKAGLAAALFGTVMIVPAEASKQEPVRNADFGPAKSGKGYVATYDAKPQIETYATLVHRLYSSSHKSAQALQRSIKQFLDAPSESTLAAARFAWINARTPYLQTEAFRFYEGPIDHGPDTKGEEGLEGRINAWPMNEAVIDYVKGNPKAGIINNRKIKITRDEIVGRDQVNDEADVTTGWHAIEFLLWGQDFDTYGPGARPASDFSKGKPIKERRRQYLREVTALLVADLGDLVDAWKPGQKDNFAAEFRAMDQQAALSRILTGLATLSGFEMANERLAAALDSGDQEDEHSCFSDNTHNDFLLNAKGIRNVYFGAYADYQGAGLNALIAGLSPQLDQAIVAGLNRAESSLGQIQRPFDLMLASTKGSDRRAAAESSYKALLSLTTSLKEAGKLAGVKVIVPTPEK